jgi:glycosyltransferase involved in cell wall biosynthesis
VRVAFVSDGIFPHAVGGMQRHTVALANALVDAGADVDVLAPRGHESGDYRFSVVPLEWPGTSVYPLTLYRWAGRCAAAVAAGSYDVAYGQGLTLWGRLPDGAPSSVYNPHGLELCSTGERVGDVKAWPLRVGARRQARQAVFTISLGGRLTELAESCLGARRDDIRVVPNAVDVERFGDVANVPRDPRLVLFVGRLFANKGLDVLAAAAAQLPYGVRVVVVGDGPLRGEVERSTRLELAGAVNEAELRRLYAQASVLAVPSRSDGMPTVILEAFACGTPAVATDVGAISELVDDATGILLPRAEPDALAAAIRTLLDLPLERRAQMGDAASRLVRERFTWEAVARRTLEVLEEAAAR